MKIKYALVTVLLLISQTCLPSPLMDDYEHVLKIIHGKPVDEFGTPLFCGDPKPPDNNHKGLLDWLDGKGSCKKTYVPNIYGLFTPLSQMGGISQFFFDDETYNKLLALLQAMSQSKELAQLKPLPKLDMQLTFWEMAATLEGRSDVKLSWEPPVDAKRMEALLKLSHLMLSKLLFSKEEIAQIEKMARSETHYVHYKKKLTQGCYFEANEPNRLHEAMSQNRLNERVFIGTDKEESCSAIRKMVDEGKQLTLKNLPQYVTGVQTFLILFYNVLDKNYNLVSTELIHGIRENTYLDVIDRFKLSIPQKLDLFKPVSIERQKTLDVNSQANAYKAIPEDQMVRMLLIDVNPVEESKKHALITTNKANCYSCHSSVIKALDYASFPRIPKMTFSKPFEKDIDFYRDKSYERYQEKFILYRKKYLGY